MERPVRNDDRLQKEWIDKLTRMKYNVHSFMRERRIPVKRLFALLLAAVMAMSLFAACVQEPAQHEPVEDQDTTPQPQEVTLSKTVIYDENDIKITVTGMKDGWLGPEFEMELVNNSDKDFAFSVNKFVVNGITIGGLGYIEVAAGEEVCDVMYLFSEEMETAGIETLSTVKGMDCCILGAENAETLYEFTFTLTTSIGAVFEQPVNREGEIILSRDEVTVISQTFTHETYGEAVRLLVLNDAGVDIAVEAKSVVVNGVELGAWMYDIVYMDTARYCELDLFSSDLGGNDIEKIETVSFQLVVTNNRTYETIVETEMITLTVGEETE